MCYRKSAGPDRKRIGLGYEMADLLDRDFSLERKRNEWLGLVRCIGCRQACYVAIDAVDGDYNFLRLSRDPLLSIRERDAWPPDFDDFVNLWQTEPPPN